jgi:hypothetical protein
MPTYRVYRLQNERPCGPPVEFEVGSDDAAIRQAEHMQDGVDLELWQGRRFLRGFPSDGKQALG